MPLYETGATFFKMTPAEVTDYLFMNFSALSYRVTVTH